MIPVANHLWQSTFFAAGAGLLTLALRRNRAAVRYWIWFAASVKFLIPFSLLIGIGSQLEWRHAPAIAQPQFAQTIYEFSQPFAMPSESLPMLAVPTPHSQLPVILLTIWLCGVILGLIFWMRLLLRMRAIKREATPLHLNLPIPVIEASERMEPGVVGVLKPVLILPAGITDRLTPPQLEAVLAHELCHVRRKDNLTAAIHMLVEILFWFHPLVWWIRTRLVEERERACDEAVASDPQIYAEAILNVCRFYFGSPLPCVSGVTGSDLKKRIDAIMNNRLALRLNFTRKAVLITAGVAALAVPLITGVLNAASAFEAASIKRAADTRPPLNVPCITFDCTPERLRVDRSRVEIDFMSLRQLIITAYRIKPYQLSGPAWMASQRFDILAAIPRGVSTDKVPEMLQALLAERFRLSIHRESAEQPVYGLAVGRNGLKLHAAAKESDPPATETPDVRSFYVAQGDIIAPEGLVRNTLGQGGMHIEMLKVTMPELADLLTSHEDRPVIDMTQLRGSYRIDFDSNVPPPPPRQPGDGPFALPVPPGDYLGAGLRKAVAAAGLTLERTRGPVEIVIVDHLEKMPTQN